MLNALQPTTRPGDKGWRSLIIIRWNDHAKLYAINGQGMRYLVGGKLHALVDIALMDPRDLDRMMIETDNRQMFCRQEIAYIGMLADRPVRG